MTPNIRLIARTTAAIEEEEQRAAELGYRVVELLPVPGNPDLVEPIWV